MRAHKKKILLDFEIDSEKIEVSPEVAYQSSVILS